MVKTKFKKAVSLMLAAVMSLTAFTGIGATTAFAAVGEKADVYLVDYPRSGDTNNNGEWGHGNLNYMNDGIVEFIWVDGKRRIKRESFDKWYASQSKYTKVKEIEEVEGYVD